MSSTTIIAEPGSHRIDMTRELDAPRDLVYRAFTDPALLVEWQGPRRLTMEIERNELRDGGTWRYIHREADGTGYGFRGVFHGDPSPDLMVRTFEFEGFPGHVSLETVVFEERDGRTLVTMSSVFQTVEDRDGMIASGMEGGLNEGFERLDELLAGMAVTA